MIEVSHLTKKYGPLTAVDDISFTASEGEILGFLGPNGAGKTTTMNMITGYISITGGKASIAGYDIYEQPMEAKKRIGYLPEQPPLYPDMTVDEYLGFISRLKKSMLGQKHIDEICQLVRLTDVRGRLIKNLSKGYRQRVGIAQALVGNPPVIILDEPTVGLDPSQIVETRSVIKKLGKRHTVILSTHILSEVQSVCDRIIVLNQGRIVADNSPEELAARMADGTVLVLTAAAPEMALSKALSALKEVRSVSCTARRNGELEFTLETYPGKDARKAIFDCVSGGGWTMLGLREQSMSLEDIFITLTNQ